MKRKFLLAAILCLCVGIGFMIWESRSKNYISKSFDILDINNKTTLYLNVKKAQIYNIRVLFSGVKETNKEKFYEIPLSLNLSIHDKSKEILNLDYRTSGIAMIDKKGGIYREVQTLMLEQGEYSFDIKVLQSVLFFKEFNPKIIITKESEKNSRVI